MDEVVITRGIEKKHIWTFAALLTERTSELLSVCPCANMLSTQSIPSFVGQNYFCETGVILLVNLLLDFILITHSGMERDVGQEVLAAS